ncbi:PstS family phosphate ABC transporter substrate-binding protein [Kiloniella sp. b19]|uniref:PstS family phosphate ABC transporter substrate-binding protein n=1 Tax=Kiloniella sp. GXU_MW_B19 TaxID=3141326 RepID=UPI0031DE54BA
MIKKILTATVFAGAVVAAAGAAQARDQIRIVGSSTVFPFSTAVAEQFGKDTDFKTPVVESTGSGGGMKLFCAGVGVEHPDITNASRRIKSSEFEKCSKNGVTITEVKVGFDGIVLANAKSGERFNLTKKQIFQALAKQVPVDGKLVDNPYKKWSDIDSSLPDLKIEVLGPPPTSGTRDAFVELALEGGAKKFDSLAALRKEDKKAFKAVAHAVREDGAYVEAGENDNLIVQKLEANPAALGIFGFSFLDQNSDKVQGSIVDGAEPTFENIADGEYGVSRSLFFYVKKEHVGSVPGIQEFVNAFTDEDAWGDVGYLTDKGLIPLPSGDRDSVGSAARNLSELKL